MTQFRLATSLTAAALIAALGGFVAATPARADSSNGLAQQSIENFNNGRGAAPASDAIAAAPAAEAMQMPTAGVDGNDYSTKSHGRP